MKFKTQPTQARFYQPEFSPAQTSATSDEAGKSEIPNASNSGK